MKLSKAPLPTDIFMFRRFSAAAKCLRRDNITVGSDLPAEERLKGRTLAEERGLAAEERL